jgi:hypothetical protein
VALEHIGMQADAIHCCSQAVSMGDGGGSGQGGSGRQAYVTLLYGEAFMLGVRVLGQSLRETGTTRCLLLRTLCTCRPGLSTTQCAVSWSPCCDHHACCVPVGPMPA